MSNLEVILNLWFVCDEDKIVYSLRVKPYVMEGPEEEKLAFLQSRAQLDYLIAEPFPIPDRFHMTVDARKMPVCHISLLEVLDTRIALFEDAIKVIDSRFPAQSNIDIPKNPLVCITPLTPNAYGVIEPSFLSEEQL